MLVVSTRASSRWIVVHVGRWGVLPIVKGDPPHGADTRLSALGEDIGFGFGECD